MKNNKNLIAIIGIIITIIVVITAFVVWYLIDRENERKEDLAALVLKDNLKVEFLAEKNPEEFIESLNGTLIYQEKIDTTKIGVATAKIKYISQRGKEKERTFEVEVIDTEAPIILCDETVSIKQGYEGNLKEDILSVDNADENPKREILGSYDVNVPGKYDVKFVVTDASGNKAEKYIEIEVYVPTSNSGDTQEPTKYEFSDIVTNYKKLKTEIGIDVSEWQDDIDWDKVKDAGVEFAFIRLGYQNGFGGKCELDDKFERNIKEANRVGIPVGVYFYSYAATKEEAREQAYFVTEHLSGYTVDLPIAFDWESWGSFVKQKFSLYSFNSIAKEFINFVENEANGGWKGMLYSSKYYLENIWQAKEFDTVWLANYTEATEYKGKYKYWQMCNTGIVDGINGDVDINIKYNNVK